MICQMCGQRDGTVHLLEMSDGQQRSIWLCNVCAAGRAEMSLGDLAQDLDGKTFASQGEQASLTSFLGQVRDTAERSRRVPACPDCGYELTLFQETNRLGCSGCYAHFRRQVLPLLTRYHRHASHLGKVPAQAGGAARQQGEITRLRVALEKAIQGENYEEAARLRDIMRDAVAKRDKLAGLSDRQDPS